MSDLGWCGKHNYRSQTTDAVCPHCKRERENADEIEALRAKLDNESSLRCEETQRLRTRADYSEGAYENLKRDHDKALERIEELEKVIAETLNMRQEIIDKVMGGEQCHIIAHDQIDAVWELVNDQNVPYTVREWFIKFLGWFGIVQCEECDGGGVGDIETSETTGPLGTFEFACESCHGEGWVINND